MGMYQRKTNESSVLETTESSWSSVGVTHTDREGYRKGHKYLALVAGCI